MFVSGRPSEDRYHPDYAPNTFLTTADQVEAWSNLYRCYSYVLLLTVLLECSLLLFFKPSLLVIVTLMWSFQTRHSL